MPPTILIVDDSKLARIVAAKATKALQPDWERMEAANAAEAIALVEAHHIDVILIDFNMPGQNGLELAKVLRDAHPTLPIALITANVQDEIIARARAMNAAFVGKPVTEDALRPFLTEAATALEAGRA